MNNTLLGRNDFTLYQEGGKLMSGDFIINAKSDEDSLQEGGTGTGAGSDSGPGSESSDILKNLAMPLYYFSQKGGKKGQKIHNYAESEPENTPIIDNNIFDKLLGMIQFKGSESESESPSGSKKVVKKRGTRKHIDNPKQKNGKKSRKFREKNKL